MAEAMKNSPLVTRSELFAGLPSSVCTNIVSTAHTIGFMCRQRLYFAGDRIEQVVLLTDGRVKLTQCGKDGTEIILRLCIPGELISERALVPGGRHSSTAQALQDCKALAWDSVTFEAALERFPVLRCNANRVLEQRLQELERRFCEVSTEMVAPRLAHQMVRLLKQIGHKVNGHVEINVTQEVLAQMTSMTAEVVCRLLKNWENQGLLRLRRKAIEIHSVPRFYAAASDRSHYF
jgi:CRP/FNR family transcriptional regulator, polysaccharide utilization system transcription regulator